MRFDGMQFFVAIFLRKHFLVLFTCSIWRFQTFLLLSVCESPTVKLMIKCNRLVQLVKCSFFWLYLKHSSSYTPGTSRRRILIDFVSNQKWHKVHHVLFLLVSANIVQSVPAIVVLAVDWDSAVEEQFGDFRKYLTVSVVMCACVYFLTIGYNRLPLKCKSTTCWWMFSNEKIFWRYST
jgi:hypothetical protein